MRILNAFRGHGTINCAGSPTTLLTLKSCADFHCVAVVKVGRKDFRIELLVAVTVRWASQPLTQEGRKDFRIEFLEVVTVKWASLPLTRERQMDNTEDDSECEIGNVISQKSSEVPM